MPSTASTTRRRRSANGSMARALYRDPAPAAHRFLRRVGSVALLATLPSIACSHTPRPWEEENADAATVLDPRGHRAAGAALPLGDASALHDSDAAADDALPSVPVGGIWQSCYDGFRLTGDPM